VARKKKGNGVAATIKAARLASKKLNGESAKVSLKPVKLTEDEKRWRENLIMKQDAVNRERDSKILRLIEDEKEMFASIKQRTGVDVSVENYDLDWMKLLATPKAKPGKASKAKPGPKPKRSRKAKPQTKEQAQAQAN
jgi:hypothetical protein